MAVCVCVCVRDTGLLQHGIDACDTYKFLDANKCRLCALFLRCASAPKNAVCGNAKRPQGALFGHNQRVLLAHRHIAWFAYVCATCTEVERGGERWGECACVRVCVCARVCAYVRVQGRTLMAEGKHGCRQATYCRDRGQREQRRTSLGGQERLCVHTQRAKPSASCLGFCTRSSG